MIKAKSLKLSGRTKHDCWNVFKGSVLTAAAFSTQGLVMPLVSKAETVSPRPYAVFVNGNFDCCAWDIKTKPDAQGMTELQRRLAQDMNVEIRQVPYSNFTDKGTHVGAFNENPEAKVELNDKKFIEEGAKFINTELDPERPLILIGHSFGGDSILKLLPEINRTRKILFVGVLDPVPRFALRTRLQSYSIPSNVGYFFNRWQQNGAPPIDYQVSGKLLSCQAQIKCDQADLSLRDIALVPQSNPSAKPDKDLKPNPHIYDRNFLCSKLESFEIPKGLDFLCPTGVQAKVLPANAVAHSDLPVLPEVQTEIGDILSELLSAPK